MHPLIIGQKSLILPANNISIIDGSYKTVKTSTNIPFFGDLKQLNNDEAKNDFSFNDDEKEHSNQLKNINTADTIEKEADAAYIYNLIEFGAWEGAKNFNEWLSSSNLSALDEEIDFGLTDGNGNKISVLEWIKIEENGVSNSIKVEPLTFYPESTEEIYCKKLVKNSNTIV